MTFWMTFFIFFILGIATSIVIFLPLIREDMELQEKRKKIAEKNKKLDEIAEEISKIRAKYSL